MHRPQEEHSDLGLVDEAHLIATRLAAASEVFPIKNSDDWDSTVYVTAEADVITIVVTDHLGREKREYRAVVQFIAEVRTAPVDPGASTPSGSRSVPTHHQESETNR